MRSWISMRLIHIPGALKPSLTDRGPAWTCGADLASIENTTTTRKGPPMQTSMNNQANQCLARAWALLDRAE